MITASEVTKQRIETIFLLRKLKRVEESDTLEQTQTQQQFVYIFNNRKKDLDIPEWNSYEDHCKVVDKSRLHLVKTEYCEPVASENYKHYNNKCDCKRILKQLLKDYLDNKYTDMRSEISNKYIRLSNEKVDDFSSVYIEDFKIDILPAKYDTGSLKSKLHEDTYN